MLHAEIAKHPTGEDNEGLEHDIAVDLPAALSDMQDGAVEPRGVGADNDEGEKDEGREEGVEEEHRDDGVRLQGLLLKRIVAAQKSC